MVRLALAAALLALPGAVFGSGFLALVASGAPAEVRAAIERGANVNERGDNGWTPLMIATRENGNPEVISLLLASGARLEDRDVLGHDALMVAPRSSPSPEVITELLQAGADARLKSAEGKTAYELALGNSALAGTRQLEELRRAGQ